VGQNLAQKQLGSLMLGVVEQIMGRGNLDHLSLIHKYHPVGRGPSKTHSVPFFGKKQFRMIVRAMHPEHLSHNHSIIDRYEASNQVLPG
jgi:hypothetical protein